MKQFVNNWIYFFVGVFICCCTPILGVLAGVGFNGVTSKAQAQAVVVPDQAQGVETLWYAIEIDGKHTGWQQQVRYKLNKQMIKVNVSEMTVKRGDETVTMRTEQKYAHDLDRQLRWVEYISQTGQEPVKQMMRFLPNGKRQLVTIQNGQTQSKMLDAIEGEWQSPWEADILMQEAVMTKQSSVVLRTLDLSMGLEPTTMRLQQLATTPRQPPTMTEQSEEEVEKQPLPDLVPTILDHPVAATYVGQSEVLPDLVLQLEVDQRGQLLRSQMHVAGMDVVTTRTTQAVLSRDLAAPELMVRLFIQPNQVIKNPRQLKSATYIVSMPESVSEQWIGKWAEGLAKDSDGGSSKDRARDWGHQFIGQRVIDVDGHQVTLQVNRLDPKALNAVSQASNQEAIQADYLNSSRLIASDDPLIQQLVEKALASFDETNQAKTDFHQADFLRGFVNQYISRKDLSVGFASASEAARTKRGDCTEHAVLLAAMLRHAGLPARVVSGLLYVESIQGQRDMFGFHMWTQVYLPKQKIWVDLDAMIREPYFDAAHIGLAVLSLSDDQAQAQLNLLLPLLNGLAIDVIELGY